MPKSIQIAVDIPTGAKAQNVEWMNDYAVDDLGKFRCNIVVSSDSVVEYTINSGTNWMKLNSGEVLKANCSYGYDIFVRASDLVNFRTPTIGGTTLILGRLDSVKNEGWYYEKNKRWNIIGSLAPQGGGSVGSVGGSLSLVVVNGENESFALTTSYTNALVIDLQQTTDHVIQIKNTSGVATVDYKIYASPKVIGTAPVDADDSWFNVLNGTDPSTYSDTTSKTIPINGVTAEGISNRFAWLRIQAKGSVGTPVIKIWVRGTNLWPKELYFLQNTYNSHYGVIYLDGKIH